MNQTLSNTVRSEQRIQSIFSLLAVVVLPPFLALVLLAKLSMVADPTVLDQAQLAQHIAAGQGFVTQVLRPLSVALQPAAGPHLDLVNASTLVLVTNTVNSTAAQPHSDLVNAPAYPVLLAAVDCLAGAGDLIPPAVGIGLWLVTVWLVYWMCRVWWNGRVGGLAAVLYAASSGAMNAAVGGRPEPLLGLFVLGATWAAWPKAGVGAGEKTPLAAWRLALAGLLCGGAVLTDYLLLPLALVLGVFLALTNARRARAIVWFVAGLSIVLGPWFARNLLVGGGGLFGLYWSGLLTNTGRFPGETVWQSYVAPPSPVGYLLVHPVELVRKIMTGLLLYRSAGITVLEPVGLFLFGVVLFGAPAGCLRKRLAFLIAASLGLSVFLSCVRQPDPRLLLAWLPLIAVVGAAQLVAWAEANLTAVKINSWRIVTVTAPARQMLAYAAIALLVAVPPLVNLICVRSVDKSRVRLAMEKVRRQLPATGVVLTDSPAEVAFWLNRPALWLPQREEDLTPCEARSGEIITAIYISPRLAGLGQGEFFDWWAWPANSRGVYRGLVAAANSPLPGVLRLLPVSPQPAAEADELARSQAAVRENPQSAEAHAQLANYFAAAGRLREAFQAFQTTIQLDEFNLDAWLGLWQTQAQLNQPDGTLRLAQLVAQAPAQDPRTKPLLEQAVIHFAQSIAQQPNSPWLLLNLLECRARLGQWEQLQADYASLTAILPNGFPPRLLLANLYLQQGALEKAATECDQLLRDHPEMPTPHQMLARIRLAQGKLDEALAEARVAVRLRPRWLAAYLQAADLCQRLQHPDEAVKYLEQALEISPKRSATQLNLAQIYSQQNRPAAAIEVYQQVLKINPDQLVALNNLALLLAKAGQTGPALVQARQALALAPQNSSVRDTVGWICFLANQPDEAAQHLREAIRLAPNHWLACYHLGKVLLAQNRAREGRELLQRAVAGGLPAEEQADAQGAITKAAAAVPN